MRPNPQPSAANAVAQKPAIQDCLCFGLPIHALTIRAPTKPPKNPSNRMRVSPNRARAKSPKTLPNRLHASRYANTPQRFATTETGTASNVKIHPRPSQRDNGINVTIPNHKPGATNMENGCTRRQAVVKLAEADPKTAKTKLTRIARTYQRGSPSQCAGRVSITNSSGRLVYGLVWKRFAASERYQGITQATTRSIKTDARTLVARAGLIAVKAGFIL